MRSVDRPRIGPREHREQGVLADQKFVVGHANLRQPLSQTKPLNEGFGRRGGVLARRAKCLTGALKRRKLGIMNAVHR